MHHWVCPFRTSSVAASLPYLTLVYPASRWVQMGTHWRHSALSVASSSASSQVMSMSFESRLVMSIQFFHGRIFAAYFIKLFWSRNRSHIATHLLVVGAMLFRKPDVSNQIGIVLQVNTGKHRMTVSYYQDGGHGVHLLLSAAYAAASTGCPLARRARDIGSPNALQFLIHNTFVLVIFTARCTSA